MSVIAGPDAIFFDVDGVLIDSMSVKGEAFAGAFADYPEERPRIMDFHHRHGGVTRSEKLRQLFTMVLHREPSDAELADRVAAFGDAVRDAVIAAPEIPGANAAVERWGSTTDLHAISATPDDELQVIFAARGLTGHFKSVQGWPPMKAQYLAAVIDDRGYQRDRCIMVGDSSEDLRAALEVGVPFIQVLGPSGDEFPEADACVADLRAFDDAVRTVLATHTD